MSRLLRAKSAVAAVLVAGALAPASASAVTQTDVRTGMVMTAQRYAKAHSSSGNLPVPYTTSVAFSYWLDYPRLGRGCARFKMDMWWSTDVWVRLHATIFNSQGRDTGYYDFGGLSAEDVYVNYRGYNEPGGCP